MSSTQHTIGIDLGTTNSVVAVIEDGNPVVILNAEGQPKTPSVVAFLEDGEVVTGEIARRQGTTQPQRTISSVKRLIGRLKEELDEEDEDYPFELREDDRGRVAIVVDDDLYTPEQISALILEKLKAAAEEHLGEEVTRAVVTVPAYFDDVQRQATLEAARIAGLEVMRLINEPTAAAMAYGLNKEAQEIVAIYDFGGGTFDFSVLDIDGKTFEVMVSQGNSRLGGDDLDIALVDHVAERFVESTGIDLRDDILTLRRLKDEVERVKCELSTSITSTLSLPFIAYSDGDPHHLEEVITRETLEEVIEPYVEETLECCRKALNESGIRKTVISKVILVGGSTRIPMVQDAVEDFFGLAPFRGVNVDEIVAVGAAMQAAVLDGHLDEVILLDVTPHTLGIEIKGNRRSILIDRNATIPIKVEKTFTTTEQDQSFVNIHLLQGEDEKGSDNRSLGKFTLSDIPPAAAGVPRIRVEIFVNADGVVELSATETHSGVEKKLATTFAYLDANERRARQGLSASRRRKRRRRSKQKARAAQMKILDGTSAREKSEPAPLGDQVVETLPEIAEADSTPVETGPVKGKARPARKSKPKKAKKKSASKRERKARTSKTAPAGEASPAIVDEATELEASQAAATAAKPRPKSGASPSRPAPARAAAALSPTDRLPEAMSEMALSLEKEADDDKALALYELHRKQLAALSREHEEDETLAGMKVKLLILTKQPEEARDALVAMRKSWPDREALHYSLYGLLCHRYPNYVAARRERAELARSVGELKMAMLDLEFVSKRDDADTAIFQTLGDVYEAMLDSEPDSTLQFKLVKVYLRKGALDEAIALLQQMVQEPGNRDQANKVLGLCFWQKGLRYLALQKFKTLPVDDEVKDILYRLGGEMEEKDELLHAQYALERVYETDIGYRDTAERLKKISYRIDLLKDQRYGSEPLGPLDPNAATIQEPLLGDRFEVLGEINRGSMGIVYKAHDRTLDEIVAIKILNDYFCTDPQAVERFKKEARSARRLSHENIVRIHDFMSIDEKKLISMEYIEGEDMKAILARNATFTEDMLMLYLHQICDAMAYAHRLGIVHRDIKPANIMIDERNRVKVTDFGIAKVLDGAATNAGTMIVGTPLYMSPEQIQGSKIDQRADIYALGIMIYELVTGAPPFHEGSIEYQHLHSPVPEITAGISSKLREAIFRCVEKNPDDRFQSIEELTAFLPEIGSPLKK